MFRLKAKIGGLWNISARFGFVCRRYQFFVTISFILGSVLLYLSNKGVVVAVSFFFSFKSWFLSYNVALSICCSINDLLYPSFWNWLIIFVVWLKNFAVKNRFVLSVKLGCRVCYLSAICFLLLFVVYYFDLFRLEHLGI